MVLAAEWGTGQVFWSMLWFFLWIIWLWLLIMVFTDIFRSRDLSGGRAGQSSIVLPYLGVFVYLIARGNRMSENATEAAVSTMPRSGSTSREGAVVNLRHRPAVPRSLRLPHRARQSHE